MTTAADITALVAMLRHIQCEPASFDTYSMASAAERAADAIERLSLSAIDDQEICRRGDEIILELDRKLAAAQSSLTAGERLAAFGAAVLEESRDDLCDLDGGWLQEKAVELGVLVEVPVTEACDESTCRCAEYGFPTTCYRYAPEVCAAMEKANG